MKKSIMVLFAIIACSFFAGCTSLNDSSAVAGSENLVPDTEKESDADKESDIEKESGADTSSDDAVSEETIKIAELYRDIYEEAMCGNVVGSLDIVRDVIYRLGENGYTAVDMENQNQIDMVNPEPVEEFCSMVDAKQESEVTFFLVMENAGLVRYDLKTADGKVLVKRTVLGWEGTTPQITFEDTYEAMGWSYSKEGYLFFEKELPPGYDGSVGYTAVRIKPLDEKCRELNRKYMQPVEYRSNNMFVVDWSESDFGELNFYDVFDVFYSEVYKKENPYEHSVEGEQYRVPEQEFEDVIMAYFHIDRAGLREKTTYSAENHVYEYHTRGFQDSVSSPTMPYPEVVAYTENEDGTLTLTVNVVWPFMHLSKAYSHEVVIRPFADGTFQYVSNHIIPSEENVEPEWYDDVIEE